MMLFTHIIIGLLIGGLYSGLFNQYWFILLFLGVFGNIFPDLDSIILDHRKSLHLVSIYPILGFVFLIFSYYQFELFFISFFFFSCFIHCICDLLGSGVGIRPWENDENKGVYDHFQRSWIKSSNILYDGSPKDFSILLVGTITFIAIFSLNTFLFYLIIVNFSLGLFYSIIRKKYPKYIEKYMDDDDDFLPSLL